MAEPRTVIGNPNFKLIFIGVLFLTVLCFGFDAVLSIADKAPAFQETCDFGFKAGFGGMLGLLGGKVSV